MENVRARVRLMSESIRCEMQYILMGMLAYFHHNALAVAMVIWWQKA